MAWITDSLRGAIEAVGRLNPLARFTGGGPALPGIFTHQLALAAYMSSGMMRKVIAIPAEDRVREWRDWQAAKEQITALEEEEERLALIAKVQEAETLRGIGGGALIIITTGDHAEELKPDAIGKGGIVAINVVSRWQIRGKDWIRDLASPQHGEPTMWEIEGENGTQIRIHPSRVIPFRGARIPAGGAISDEDAFWGDSRLLRVFNEVTRSDETQAWFAALVRKAKLLRIGIPDLDSRDPEQLARRMEVIALGESSLNATVYRSSGGQDDAGEKLDDYQVTWAGIPAMMDAFDQRVAAVSDIPFTRLTGRSPAGMNATGESDDRNWNKMVMSGQQLETRPCLAKLDPVLIRSAGVSPDGIWWKWAPLSIETDKEATERFKVWTDAMENVRVSSAVPDEAYNKGYQNGLIENGFIPGIDAALDDIPEDERYGLNPSADGTDPSALQSSEGGDPASAGGGTNVPAGRATQDGFFTDAQPRPLYVQRKLLNASELITWAKKNGFTSTLAASDMHVTVLYSRTAVDPMKMGESWAGDDQGRIRVKPGGPRAIERFGENAVVLLFASWELESRHRSMVDAGGSHDFDEYHPHVTISFEAPADMDLTAVKPFTGALEFGPELFEPLDLDWKRKITEN
ncbi:phage portal protein [Novosphingobium sp. MBES04]|uniref:phage portal protein n=1 Tax=Novosphingobium sp. MBES04 TaxID=1206458 RepID=UPI0007234C27|nr:anti-CBASS Acb1 family protein [Novosphingobium sp. MBES04]GAM06338.1 portal protein [Novosphingobium sp. MBES04]